MSQRDSAPLMSGAGGAALASHPHQRNSFDPNQHPAYRTNDPNASNPFTPEPPVRRKPVPSNGSTFANRNSGSPRSHSHSPHSHHQSHTPALAAGAAGAAVGAAATHHHEKNRRSSNPSPRNSFQHDPNRPPTPFGLAAFGPSRSSNQAIEPSVSHHNNTHPYAHTADMPTAEQRRSLHEREMRDAYVPGGRSPRLSFVDNDATAVAGRRRSSTNGTRFHDSTYASNTDSSDDSRESWKSAQMGYASPSAPWRESARYSGEYSPQRSYGDGGYGEERKSFGGGNGKRLRFSDSKPEEYRYAHGYEPAGHYDGHSGVQQVGQAL